MYKKWSFSLRITPVNIVNMTKSAFSCAVINVLRNIMFWRSEMLVLREMIVQNGWTLLKFIRPNLMVVFLITFAIIKNDTEIQNFSLSQIYNSTSWAMNYQRIKIQKLEVWRIALAKSLMQIINSHFNSIFCTQFYNFILYMNLCLLPHS